MSERLPETPIHLDEKQESKDKFSTLDGLQEHFIRLYGRRNGVYLPGRTIRIEFFHRGITDLIDSIRKESDRETIENMFARLVSRTFCIAHGINNVSIAQGLQRKYPLEGCSYCHSSPCQCGERRSAADLGWGSSTERR